MKKVIVASLLGAALVVSSGARADQRRPVEPGWGVRPGEGGVASALDLARWLARRLNEGMAVPVPVPLPPPPSIPGANPVLGSPDAVCIPDRSHCPTG